MIRTMTANTARTTVLRIGSALRNVDHGLGERLRGLLRQIVPDPAGDGAMLILAGELAGVSGRRRMRRAVGIAFHGDRRYGDDRRGSKLLLERVEFRIAFGEAL